MMSMPETVPDAGEARILRFQPAQPEPEQTRVVHFQRGRSVTTAIFRRWKPGESGPNGSCRLCPQCKAYDDGCLIVVGRHVGYDEARLLDTSGIPRGRSVIIGDPRGLDLLLDGRGEDEPEPA